ncbi:MAG: hypothetical protein M0R05_06980, partial [Bacilli bacterium]|nr:hypothetical protein [Bacilli bacterium]
MKKTMMILMILLLTLCLPTVAGSAPYKTETVNRFGELIPTQDAYEPYYNLAVFSYDGNKESLNKPQDIFIDGDDYIYLVDTGNRRIVIFDGAWHCLNIFGTDLMMKPQGIFVRDNRIYIADYGTESDNQSGRIFIYDFNKTTNTVTFFKALGVPKSPILTVENFIYRPQKISVDQNGTMYITSQGASNGILLVNNENRFLNYFAPNAPSGSFWDLVKDFFYGNKKDVLITKKIPPAPINVMLDDTGYIYTVTRTVVRNDLGDALKRVNIGGINFFPYDMVSAGSFVDCWSSAYGTVYAVTANGYVYEYDIEGNLLFRFAGPIASDEQLGLFRSASAVAVNSLDILYVVDDTASSVQFFRKTNFTINVHIALKQYTEGRYPESEILWEEVLRYNSLFDLAYKGIGMAKHLDGNYHSAMRYFRLANSRAEYSEAFWEVRNLWLINHMADLMIGFFAALAVIIGAIILNRRYALFLKITAPVKALISRPGVTDQLVMFKFIRHPFKAVYDVRYNKNIKVYSAFGFLLVIFAVYIVHLVATGFLFNPIILERTFLIKEALKIGLPVLLFVIGNHLISSLMSGEGTLRSIFINTVGSLGPVLILLPPAILISNILTYNESFIYYFLVTALMIWVGVLLFVVIKETHNFTFKQTVINLILTLMMMLIIVVVILLVYLVIAQ